MSSTAIKPDQTVAIKDSRVVWWLQKAGWTFDLWKREFSVFKDRRIYADFLWPEYQQHNVSRLQHLESLGLDLAKKSVLELGAGIGDHSLFYLYRNCRVLAVETCVAFGEEPKLNNCREMSSKPSQALHGEGCRPTRKWVFDELKLHYPYVYVTRTQPRHREFPTDWTRSRNV